MGNKAKVKRYIDSLKLTDHDGEVKFQEVIDKIVRDKEPKGIAEASGQTSSKGGFDLASISASAKALGAQDSPKLDQFAGPATLGTKRLSAGVVSVFAGAAKNMKVEGDKLKESEEKLKELGENLKESRPGGRPSGPRQLLGCSTRRSRSCSPTSSRQKIPYGVTEQRGHRAC